MIGAIIGDIVGSRWEFDPTNDYNFEWLSDENGFTDDTICTVAVADALLKGRDFGDSIHEWCRRYPYPMGGYGGRFAQWVHSDNHQPYNSFGNGSAMRVSPVAHWFDTVEEVLKAAAATALPSHSHPEGVKGAQTVALAIFKALLYNRHHYQEAALHIDEILQECVQFSGYDINMPKASVLNRFDETCQGTVPVALKIISMATDFEDAVRLAVSLGADADTLGAIVGSIAEAIWGIPLYHRNAIEEYLLEDMHIVLDEFYRARPRSFKPLIDTTFYRKDYSEAAWDMLEEKEREGLQGIVEKEKNEKRRLMEYTYKYPRPAVTADCVVMTKEATPQVLLIERGAEPFKGCWAFSGGFLNMDETTEQCAIRELEEETGLVVKDLHQIGAYSKVDRDPRGRTITVAYLVLVDHPFAVSGQDDAAKAQWWPIDKLPTLAFDHEDIMRDAITLYQTKVQSSL